MFTLRSVPAILLLSIIMTGIVPVISSAQNTSAARYVVNGDDNIKKMESDVLNIINQYRRGKGLAALQSDENFTREAERHSEEMAGKKTTFGHEGFEGRVQRLMKKSGPLKMSAENVAYGQISATEVVNNWLKSPGHKKNIEGNFTTTGIGITRDKNGILFFTQIFAAR